MGGIDFAAFRYGYRGDTFGAMSVAAGNGMHPAVLRTLPSNLFLEASSQGFDAQASPILEPVTRWREQLAAHRQELAAVIN